MKTTTITSDASGGGSSEGVTDDEADMCRRPWGHFRVLDSGEGFVTKSLTVLPGRRLSLQRHVHRDEKWIVAAGAGTAEVDGGARIALQPGVQVSVPAGVWHRLQAAESSTLVVVEVQLGSHLSEEDIARKEDDYGRVTEESVWSENKKRAQDGDVKQKESGEARSQLPPERRGELPQGAQK